jgi:parallel beta-helix repeat protein
MRHPIRFLLAGLLLAQPALAGAATFRYVAERNQIVVENGGPASLGAIKAALPHAPLSLVDRERRIWLLGANLVITSGSALRLHGPAAGGDVAELRLKSNNSSAGGSFVSVTADHGYLDIRATRITSWDTERNGPDTEYESYGRAFIRVRSRLRSMVLIPLQSRMDITDSEVAYLGYGANESYGLVWKVVAPQPYVFGHVRVYGNVVRSRIHHNYFGLYTSGAQDSEWRDNQVYQNVHYGLAPHNRSDDLRIERNDVHHNGHHGITVRQRCLRASIRDNRVWRNGEGGITVHRDSNDAVVTGNEVFANAESGITIYASSGAVVRDNVSLDNGMIGVQLAMGTTGSRVENNEIGGNHVYGVFVGQGKGRPETPDAALPRRNVVAGNLIYGSGGQDLRTGDMALNRFADNTVLLDTADELLTGAMPDPFRNPRRGMLATAESSEPADRSALASRRMTGRPYPEPPWWRAPNNLLWGALSLLAGLLLLRSRPASRATAEPRRYDPR